MLHCNISRLLYFFSKLIQIGIPGGYAKTQNYHMDLLSETRKS